MIDSLINTATARFASSRKIPDELIPFFDQNGNWVGDRPNWRSATFATAKARMRKALLPMHRRTKRTPSGLHLLTTFVWKKSTPVQINYSSIAGSLLLRVQERIDLRAPNLRSIGGNFHTRSNGLIFVPWLSEVRGDFNALTNSQIRAPRLKHVGGTLQVFELQMSALETVGGRLWLSWAMAVNAPRLRRVGGEFKAITASEMLAPKLESIGKALILGNLTKRVFIPQLKQIGGAFNAGGAEEIVAGRLRSVGGPIDTHNASLFFKQNLKYEGNWEIHPDAFTNWKRRHAFLLIMRNQQMVEI